MKTYEFNYRLKYIYIVCFLITTYFLISIYLELNLNKQNYYLAIGTLILFIVPVHFIAEYYSEAKVILTLNSSYFDIHWSKLPFFIKRENRTVSWSEIEYYSYEEDEDKLTFSAKLTNGDNLIVLANSYSIQKENFRDFKVRFEQYHKNLTNEVVNDSLEYNKSTNKNFYQTKTAKIIAIINISICIGYIIYLVIFIQPNKIKLKLAILPIIATIYFVEQVWSNRRRKSVV